MYSVAVSDDCRVIASASDDDDCRVIASASYDDSIQVWNVPQDEVLQTILRGRTRSITCVALNEDGSRVVSGSLDGTVRVWNVLDVKYGVSAVEKKKERWVSALCTSVDRRVVVAGYVASGISTWDVETGRMKEIGVSGQRIGILSIAMSNDNQYVVSGHSNPTVRVWNVSTGRQVGDVLCAVIDAQCVQLRSVMTAGGLYLPLTTRHFVCGSCRAEWRLGNCLLAMHLV